MVTRKDALNVLSNADADPILLARIAYEFESLRAAVAIHPAAYEGLLKWLGTFGNDKVKKTVVQRLRANAEAAAVQDVADRMAKQEAEAEKLDEAEAKANVEPKAEPVKPKRDSRDVIVELVSEEDDDFDDEGDFENEREEEPQTIVKRAAHLDTHLDERARPRQRESHPQQPRFVQPQPRPQPRTQLQPHPLMQQSMPPASQQPMHPQFQQPMQHPISAQPGPLSGPGPLPLDPHLPHNPNHPYTIIQALDPRLDLNVMADIAAKAPELWKYLARNPATYPDLLQWLANLNDPEVNSALRTRSQQTVTGF